MNEPTTSTKPDSRLEQHAFAYRMNGFAVPGTGGCQPIMEPLWSLDELTSAERDFLDHRYQNLQAQHRDQTEGQAARLYARVLETYGIACPHPVHWRRHYGPSAFECQACELLVSDHLPRGA